MCVRPLQLLGVIPFQFANHNWPSGLSPGQEFHLGIAAFEDQAFDC